MPKSRSAVTNQRTYLRIPGKTVYVLGTGFSRPLGIPVITEFIPEGLRLLKQRIARSNSATQRHSRHRLLNDIQNVLERYMPMLRLAEAAEREPTIEDIFCAVDLLGPSKRGSGPNEHNTDSHTVKRFLREVCELPDSRDSCYRDGAHNLHLKCPLVDRVHLDLGGDLHWDFLFNPSPSADASRPNDDLVCVYFAFLSQILAASRVSKERGFESDAHYDKQADAIVSFNYDLIIERKIRWICEHSDTPARIYYGDGVVTERGDLPKWLRVARPASGEVILPLIKLHGSFNWRTDNEDNKNQGVRIEDGPVATRSPNRATTAQAGLVWPTWIREEFEGVFQKLLMEAHAHLRLASKVVFIGYSMPLTDRYIRYLLADAFNTPELPEVVICDFKKDEKDIRYAWERLLGSLAKRTKTTVFTGGFVEYVKQWKRPRMTDDQSQQ